MFISATVTTYNQCYESHRMKQWIILANLLSVNDNNKLSDLKATLSVLKAACGWPNLKSLSIKHPGNFSPDQFDKLQGSTGIQNFSQLLWHEHFSERGRGSFIYVCRRRNASELRVIQKNRTNSHKWLLRCGMVVWMFIFRDSLTHVQSIGYLQLGYHRRQ